MRAWILHGAGALSYEETIKPVPEENEVLVKVKACGICGSDIARVYKDGAHKMPLIIGHEFSGQVCEVGKSADDKWLGKRVGVFPLIPCGECGPCSDHRYEMCRNYDYLGSRRDGGFAEYVAVPEWNLIELPDNVSYEAAAMLEPMSVAMHAVKASGATSFSSCKVIGMGTIGYFVSMILCAYSVRDIYPVCNKDFQARKLEELRLDPASGDEQADIVFECVGSNEVLKMAVKTANPGGHVTLIGNPASDMVLERDIYWKVLRNQLTLHGVWNSSFTGEIDDDWHTVLDMLDRGLLTPERFISHRLNLAEMDKGLAIMKGKTEEYGKIMVVSELS